VEKMGGMVAAIEEGQIQREIAQEAYRQQQRAESGEKVIVGVNRFARPEDPQFTLYEPDPQILGRQRERLSRVKAQRDATRVAKTLQDLKDAARGTTNLMLPLTECVEAYCTVGEMNNALLEIFGRFREPVKM
jgi:methylmalonyl-CoA mutase N-terminal domain/subunit